MWRFLTNRSIGSAEAKAGFECDVALMTDSGSWESDVTFPVEWVSRSDVSFSGKLLRLKWPISGFKGTRNGIRKCVFVFPVSRTKKEMAHNGIITFAYTNQYLLGILFYRMLQLSSKEWFTHMCLITGLLIKKSWRWQLQILNINVN